MPFLPFRDFDFSSLVQLCSNTKSLCGAFLVGLLVHRRYYVPPQFTPSSLWLLQLFLILVCSVKERFGYFPFLELSGFSVPLWNVFVKSICLRQKGDPFQYHHCISNSLPSWSCKLLPLFELVDEADEGLFGVVWPHHIDCVFLKVDLFNFPVVTKQIL